jgi:hypothetical protein
MLCRDRAGLRCTAQELGALMSRHPHRGREVLAKAVLDLLDARDTGADAPLAVAGIGIDELLGLHWNFWVPWLLLFAAEICLETHRLDEAARSIERAGALIESMQYWLCAPELVRLRAHLAANSSDERMTRLEQAITVARESGARLPELRIVTDLAQLLLDNGELDRARSLIEPIVLSFTEGFDLDDVRRAQAMLASLG